VTAVRRAGHIHDVGRIGVSNQVWSKPAQLTGAEWERVRMRLYLTDRVLTGITGLAHVAAIARAHTSTSTGPATRRASSVRRSVDPSDSSTPPSPISQRWSPAVPGGPFP